MERLINLLEMYEIHTIITKDYICYKSDIEDFFKNSICIDDLLNFGHYEYFSKLKVLYFEVLLNETK